MKNPFRDHIISYIEWQKVVRLDQLRSARFVEGDYYNKELCGTFEENLDKLLEEGILKKASFLIPDTVTDLKYEFIMVGNARFGGWG